MNKNRESAFFGGMYQNPESLQHIIPNVQDTVQNSFKQSAAYSQWKRYSMETKPKMSQILELSRKNLKICIITMFNDVKNAYNE